MDTNQLENWPPVVHYHPGKLINLAAVSFVAAIQHNKVLQMLQNGWQKYDDHALDLAQVSIPNSLRKTIDSLVEKMEPNMTEWWTHHNRCVFLNKFPADDMIDWLNQLIWLPDGSIDYRKTAIVMLNSDKVPNVRKFQFACAYCLVNEVELWKKTLTEKEINDATKKYSKFDDAILNYWGARLTNIYFRGEIKDPASFLYRLKYSLKYYDEGPAIVYFLNQLDNRTRLLEIESIIDLNRPKLVWHLLPTLTGSELDVIINVKGLEIMDALVKNRYFFDYTITIWKRMVNIIDDQTLAKIIQRINFLNPSLYERSYMNPILWEMWLATSERQKMVLIDGKSCDFTEKLDYYHKYYYSPNFPLIFDVLSRFDLERRYEYLSKHWPYLVIGQLDNRNFIDRIMKLCFSNDQQIETFKNTVMLDYNSMSTFCEYLILNGRVKEISIFLEFCTSDQRLIYDLKKEIMTKTPKDDIFHFLFQELNSEKLADFRDYLDDIYTKEESEELLNKVVTDRNNLKEMRSFLRTKFQRVVEFVEKFASEKVLAQVKHHFFENCRKVRFERRSLFLDLMRWCFDGSKALVEEFKKLPPSEYEKSNITMDEFDSPIHITFLEPYVKSIGDSDTLMTIQCLKY